MTLDTPMTPVRLGAARLGVVLVNYKRADDTIECLESLLRSPLALRVVVVDNDSGDGSMDAIAAWAAGQRIVAPASPTMKLATPPLPKPIPLARLTAAEAEATLAAGRTAELERVEHDLAPRLVDAQDHDS